MCSTHCYCGFVKPVQKRGGVPDVWDFDNDGDSVPDALDTSPFAADMAAMARNTYNLTLEGYETDQLLMLDLRLRPENPDHLWLQGNVYDWPTNDDEGQITRVLDTTLADYGYTTSNASNTRL